MDQFKLDPIDKINKIEDENVRNICIVAITEAQRNLHKSTNEASKSVEQMVAHKLPKMV